MKRVVTFGEIRMRLNPSGFLRLVQADSFEATYAGGEANVAVSLANYGLDVSFVPKLPDNMLGQAARNEVRRFGVDTSDIVWGGPRLGLYFVEKGASQRCSKVVYDRAGSSLALAMRKDFDWTKILKGAGWFHFTGITPALGGECPAICLKAEARNCMDRLVPYADVLIANEEDAADVFGIVGEGSDVENGKLDKTGYVSVAEQLVRRFGVKQVAVTLRTSHSAFDNTWAGLLFDGKRAYFSKDYRLHIVDRVGGGDSFGGGLVYALATKRGPQEAIDFAVSASALKHSIEHDFNHVTVAEVEALVHGNGTGRVQR